jgi:hypothetical protein
MNYTVRRHSVVIMHGTQVPLVDRGSDGPAQSFTGVLVKSEVNATIDAGVGDVVSDLLERSVLQNDAGQCRVRYCDQVPALAVKTPKDLGCAIASAAVI